MQFYNTTSKRPLSNSPRSRVNGDAAAAMGSNDSGKQRKLGKSGIWKKKSVGLLQPHARACTFFSVATRTKVRPPAPPRVVELLELEDKRPRGKKRCRARTHVHMCIYLPIGILLAPLLSTVARFPTWKYFRRACIRYSAQFF